jgi:uncharacterized protein (TIGR03083 family)
VIPVPNRLSHAHGGAWRPDTLALVEIAQHIAALRREGELLATTAERTDLDTPLPTTPEWRMRHLLRHMGDVHRWARGHVADGRMLPIGPDELPKVAGPLPQDDALLDWFREGHARLVATLEEADPDTSCWSFLPAPSPLAFWARRQAHETGIHRADAESPGGPSGITAFHPDLATDGLDELLTGFYGDGGPARDDDPPRSLFVRAVDTEAGWLVRLNGGAARHEGIPPQVDCVVEGPASDLFLLLWNRRPADGLAVSGDRSVLGLWRDSSKITWSRSR